MCFAWISEKRAIISLYSINLPVYKTEAEGVYCAVRNGSLNQTDTVSFLRVSLGSRWELVFIFTPWSLYSRGECTGSHCRSGWAGPKASVGSLMQKKKNIFFSCLQSSACPSINLHITLNPFSLICNNLFLI